MQIPPFHRGSKQERPIVGAKGLRKKNVRIPFVAKKKKVIEGVPEHQKDGIIEVGRRNGLGCCDLQQRK